MKSYLLLSLIPLLLLSPAFANVSNYYETPYGENILLQTDKSIYQIGEEINVSGKINLINPSDDDQIRIKTNMDESSTIVKLNGNIFSLVIDTGKNTKLSQEDEYVIYAWHWNDKFLGITKDDSFLKTVSKTIILSNDGNPIDLESIRIEKQKREQESKDFSWNMLFLLTLICVVSVFVVLIIFGKKLSPKRKGFSKATRAEVLRRQGYTCAICGIKPKNWELDHIGSRADNSLSNCQGLCLDCHRNKTNSERRERDPRRK